MERYFTINKSSRFFTKAKKIIKECVCYTDDPHSLLDISPYDAKYHSDSSLLNTSTIFFFCFYI